MRRRDRSVLPLPACGERVGVRGPLGLAEISGNAPSPGSLYDPTSPRAAGRGEIHRRSFLASLVGAAAAWPLATRAQQGGKLPTIGFLGSDASAWSPWTAAFAARLRELGWIDGRTITIEYRWDEGRTERDAEIAAEFILLKVDVIVASGFAAATLKQATTVIPIIFTLALDPVGAGLVTNLARPTGNITGISSQGPDLASKRLQLLGEVVPALRRLAIIVDVGFPQAVLEMREVQAAAHTLGLGVAPIEVRRAEDIAPALEALKDQVDALYVVVDALIAANRSRVITLSHRAGLPTIFNNRGFVQAGGLMSYGPNFPDLFRRTAELADKILRGAKPGDIPVEQPTKFELVINVTAAKALDIKVPESFLALADEVIE